MTTETKTTTKAFSLGQILSITTGRLCCDMGGIYDILNHITGDNLFTHVLPRASKFAKPMLLELFPKLESAETEASMERMDTLLSINPQRPMKGIEQWLDWVRNEHGLESVYGLPCYGDRWLSLDPIAEAVAMVGEDKVAVITP